MSKEVVKSQVEGVFTLITFSDYSKTFAVEGSIADDPFLDQYTDGWGRVHISPVVGNIYNGNFYCYINRSGYGTCLRIKQNGTITFSNINSRGDCIINDDIFIDSKGRSYYSMDLVKVDPYTTETIPIYDSERYIPIAFRITGECITIDELKTTLCIADVFGNITQLFGYFVDAKFSVNDRFIYTLTSDEIRVYTYRYTETFTDHNIRRGVTGKRLVTDEQGEIDLTVRYAEWLNADGKDLLLLITEVNVYIYNPYSKVLQKIKLNRITDHLSVLLADRVNETQWCATSDTFITLRELKSMYSWILNKTAIMSMRTAGIPLKPSVNVVGFL
jgi:hypothetical protein